MNPDQAQARFNEAVALARRRFEENMARGLSPKQETKARERYGQAQHRAMQKFNLTCRWAAQEEGS